MLAGEDTDIEEGCEGILPVGGSGPEVCSLMLMFPVVVPAAKNLMFSPPCCPFAKNTTLFAPVRSNPCSPLKVTPAAPTGPGVYWII
jgi:hypothetical protein